METETAKKGYESLPEELKKEIERIFLPGKVHSGSEGEAIMPWTEGSRSQIYRILVEGEGKEDTPHYLIKINNLEKDFITEKAVLYVTNQKSPGLFPKILSYPSDVCDRYNALVLGIRDEPTLKNELEKRLINNITFENIRPFFDNVIRMHAEVPNYEEEILWELADLSQGAITDFKEIDSANYLQRFKNAAETLGLKNSLKVFQGYIENYLVGKNKEKLTITQEDGWLDHITKRGLIDANSIKRGSYVQQIGCWGHPSLFNKLKDTEKTVRLLCEYYLESTKRNESLDELEKGFYVGAIYSNLRLASFDKKYFDYPMRKTLLEQALILCKKDPELNNFKGSLSDMVCSVGGAK